MDLDHRIIQQQQGLVVSLHVMSKYTLCDDTKASTLVNNNDQNPPELRPKLQVLTETQFHQQQIS